MTSYDLWIGPPDQAGVAEHLMPPGERLRGSGVTCWDGEAAYFALRDKIAAGAVQGWQTSWGSHTAVMRRGEVEAFLADVHGPPGAYEARHAGGLEHVGERMRALRAFIAALPAEAWIAVQVSEF